VTRTSELRAVKLDSVASADYPRFAPKRNHVDQTEADQLKPVSKAQSESGLARTTRSRAKVADKMESERPLVPTSCNASQNFNG